jgi:hypothetical protein
MPVKLLFFIFIKNKKKKRKKQKQKKTKIILCKFFVVRTLEHNLWNTTAVTDNSPLSKPEQRYHET